MSNLTPGNDTDAFYQAIAFEELDMLLGKLQGATSFKAINAVDSLSKAEKKILERVFNIIISNVQDNANEWIDAILKEFVCVSEMN